ncbi:MAG: YbbR-like domain-containing protein [Lachnospiraceae bacterium]
MKSKWTDNMLLKVLSVLAAIVLWLVVVNISDAERTKDYQLEVTLKNTDVITSNGKVFRVEDGSDVVKLTVKARTSVIDTLSKNDFILTADMEKDLKYDTLVGISIECRNKNIDVENDVTLSRSNVKVSIEDSATEQFPVTVEKIGEQANGYYVGSMTPEQTILKISGPVSIVNRIKRVIAEVDVTGWTGTSVKKCKLKILGSDGIELDSTYLNYYGKEAGMDVTVNMLNTKTLPLRFEAAGTPAENYIVTEVQSKPESVEVAGNQGILQGLSELLISDAVDVEGIEGETQMIVDLKEHLPEGLMLTDENDATIVVIVKTEYVNPEPETDSEEDGAGSAEGTGDHQGETTENTTGQDTEGNKNSGGTGPSGTEPDTKPDSKPDIETDSENPENSTVQVTR